MLLYKKVIILAIIIIFSYCLYRLIKKRYTLLREISNEPVNEGFSIFSAGDAMSRELSQVQDFSNSPGIKNVENANKRIRLHYYIPLNCSCIKTTYVINKI